MLGELLLVTVVGLALLVLLWRHASADRQRLHDFATQLAAEARMEALTRATITEMRRVAREAARDHLP